jgi:electron transfer flavoprotein alpha subunit
MTVLIIAEHDNQHLNPNTLSAVSAATQLKQNIMILVAGYSCSQVAEQAARVSDVANVLLADAKEYEHALAENLSQLIADTASDLKEVDYILAPATTFGKNILPRVAALLDVTQISEITQIINENTFVRPIYAGNAFVTVVSSDRIKVITIRPTAFEKAEVGETSAPIEMLDTKIPNHLSEYISAELTKSERPDLAAAKIIISGGRGLQSAENFKLLEKIADQLNAAVGASRAAVDAGFVPNDYQIGQTGKVVAPDLYIAVGISGAIQHLAGMKDSKVIVAINKDPDAPIFQVADYGLVGDLFEILPQLEKELEKLGYGR